MQKGDLMSTVYVVQEALGKNLIPAEQFGKIKICLPPGQIMYSVGPTVRRLHMVLRSFSIHDYLLCMGDPAAIGLATAIASHVTGGKFKLLKWDKQERVYFPIEVDIFRRYDE